MSKQSEIRKLVKDLKSQGFSVVLTNGGHYKVTNDDGRHINIAASPSSDVGVRNIVARLRREVGYDDRSPKRR